VMHVPSVLIWLFSPQSGQRFGWLMEAFDAILNAAQFVPSHGTGSAPAASVRDERITGAVHAAAPAIAAPLIMSRRERPSPIAIASRPSRTFPTAKLLRCLRCSAAQAPARSPGNDDILTSHHAARQCLVTIRGECQECSARGRRRGPSSPEPTP